MTRLPDGGTSRSGPPRRDSSKVLEFLRATDLFGSLSQSDLEDLVPYVETVHLGAGETVVRQGEPAAWSQPRSSPLRGSPRRMSAAPSPRALSTTSLDTRIVGSAPARVRGAGHQVGGEAEQDVGPGAGVVAELRTGEAQKQGVP